MNSSEIKKEMIVQYWHFSGMNKDCSIQELVFVKVLSFGRVYATVENDLGIRYRVRLSELEYSREGEKSVQQKMHPTGGTPCEICGRVDDNHLLDVRHPAASG
jgi:hypothetical protein